MAEPVIRTVDPNAPVSRQQAVLVATKEARNYRERRLIFPSPSPELLNPVTAVPHAEMLLRAEGIRAPSRKQSLGKLVTQRCQGTAPLIHRLNTRCQYLFGETVEENFQIPTDVPSDELLGLEYLFRQSTGESFSLQDIVDDGPGPDEEVVQPGQPDPEEGDEAYHSDTEACGEGLDAVLPHITLTRDETSTAHPPAVEDACSLNPLPGFKKLEMFCSALVEIGLSDDHLSLTAEQRDELLQLWKLWRSMISSLTSSTSCTGHTHCTAAPGETTWLRLLWYRESRWPCAMPQHSITFNTTG
ncbi:uncharacterized protein LOC114433653 [Parambassis ranga]|uniref:Uncharacterized protein LOC114433653 n=1 Tax=Parambassis ranga TaxID=210632 RepID=A0A6P7HWU6_9TELE|nr:uncharacterized protein LOC114433653 [Parambassis ranga]